MAAAKARTLIAGKTSVAEKVRAIRDFIATQIRVAGPAYSDMPLEMLSPADATFESGYGHAADVAILTRAMLAAAVERAGVIVGAILIGGDSGTTAPDGGDGLE